MARRLERRVALITGGGTGIGAATARRFAAEGASVVLTGRRPGPIQAVANQVAGLAVAGDVRDDAHLAAAVSAAIERFHGLDIIVANAGIDAESDVASVADATWHQVLDVNLTGAMKTARAALPALVDRGGGAIVIVSSVGALLGGTGSAYGTSKAALLGLARTMAFDYGPKGIRVNAICPGWVRTEMSDAEMDALAADRGITRDEAFSLVSRHLPLRRVAEPEEIAACILFLASDDASFVTGSTLVADGGGLVVDVGMLPYHQDA